MTSFSGPTSFSVLVQYLQINEITIDPVVSGSETLGMMLEG